MNDEKWEQLVENISGQFPDAEVRTEEIDDGFEGSKILADLLIFTAPHGKFKLVRESRPLVIEKKMHYSHRPGDTARTEYKTSDTEVSRALYLYKEVDGEWEEVSLDKLGL